MIIVTHSPIRSSRLADEMGRPDYSYHFVLKAFEPVLDRIGHCVRVDNADVEIDAIHAFARATGDECLYLSFAPPHNTPLDLKCPVVPVFAWEFETLPNEDWGDDPRQNWRYVLGHAGRCITHSTHSAEVIRKSMGIDFPVLAVPSPMASPGPPDISPAGSLDISAVGFLTDSAPEPAAQKAGSAQALEASVARRFDLNEFLNPGVEVSSSERRSYAFNVRAEGVIYTSVLNVNDARKNWRDMVDAFCVGLNERSDAVLILKVVGYDTTRFHLDLAAQIERHRPMNCRVIAIDSFLREENYSSLREASSYVVNCSHGEGQCLPLMEYMLSGKPAVAPCHTGMADYITAENAFIHEMSLEPASWPHDPRGKIRTWRRRANMESLIAAFRESYGIARHQPERYAVMSEAAHRDIRIYTDPDRIENTLRGFLNTALPALEGAGD